MAFSSKKDLEVVIERLPSQTIYLNVKHFENGIYTLYILFGKKITHKTTFKVINKT